MHWHVLELLVSLSPRPAGERDPQEADLDDDNVIISLM